MNPHPFQDWILNPTRLPDSAILAYCKNGKNCFKYKLGLKQSQGKDYIPDENRSVDRVLE